MPNEQNFIALRNVTGFSSIDRFKKSLNSASTVTVWTLSGILLAACSGGSTRYVNVGEGVGGDGSDVGGGGSGIGGGAATPRQLSHDNKVTVKDGPIVGAQVWVDVDNNGEIDPAIDIFIGVTDENGQVDFPDEFHGQPIVVDVTHAYDSDHPDEALSGTWRSLPSDDDGTVLVSPLTDLIAEAMIADESDAATVQDLLNDIFGENVVTVDDILNPDNYNLFSNQLDAQLIARAAVAVARLQADDDDSLSNDGEDATATLLQQIQTLFERWRDTLEEGTVGTTSDDFTDDLLADGSLRDAIEDAVDNARGVPTIVDPNNNETLEGQEDTSFYLRTYAPELQGNADSQRFAAEYIFGFLDVQGNQIEKPGIEGVFIQAQSLATSVDTATGAEDKFITVQVITSYGIVNIADAFLDDIGTPPPVNVPDGYIYISLRNLHKLVFTPDADAHGDFNIQFLVYDGEEVSEASSPGTLTISVDAVNDTPTDLAISGDRDPALTSSEYVVLPSGDIALADGTLAGYITVSDVETALADFSFRLEGTHANLFEVDTSDPVNGPRLKLVGTPLPAGQSYDVTVIAIDEGGAEVSMDLSLFQGGLFIVNSNGDRVSSNGVPLINEELDVYDTANRSVTDNISDLGSDQIPAIDEVKASAVAGGIVFTGVNHGTADDGLRVILVEDANLSAGASGIVYDSAANTLTVSYGAGSTLQQIVDAVNADGTVSASLAASDNAATPVDATLSGGVDAVAAVAGVQAELIAGGLYFQYNTEGVEGNTLRVILVESGDLTVAFDDTTNTLTVNYTASSRSQDVIDAIQANAAAAAVVLVDVESAETANNLATAVDATLSGGVDAVQEVIGVSATVTAGGIVFTHGTDGGDGLQIIVLEDGNLSAGVANVALDSDANTLTVSYGAGSTLQQIVDAVNADGTVSATLEASDNAATPVDATLSGGVDFVAAIDRFGFDLGELGIEGGIDAAIDGHGVREFFLTDTPANEDFRIVMKNNAPHLYYVGTDSGDYESGDTAIQVEIGIRLVRVAGSIDATGDNSDADVRSFVVESGGEYTLSSVNDINFGVNVAAGQLTVYDGHDVSTITFTGNLLVPPASHGDSPNGEGFIIVYDQNGNGTGIVDWVTPAELASLTGDYFVLYTLSAPEGLRPSESASLTVQNADQSADVLTVTAVPEGTAGNNVTLTIANAPDTNLDTSGTDGGPEVVITVSGNDVSVTFGTGATLAQLIAAIENSVEASALITLTLADGVDDTTEIATSLEDLSGSAGLSGGSDGFSFFNVETVTANDVEVQPGEELIRTYTINIDNIDDNDPVEGETIIGTGVEVVAAVPAASTRPQIDVDDTELNETSVVVHGIKFTILQEADQAYEWRIVFTDSSSVGSAYGSNLAAGLHIFTPTSDANKRTIIYNASVSESVYQTILTNSINSHDSIGGVCGRKLSPR